MSDTIRVIICRVGQDPVVENIERTLDAARKIVGGSIEDVAFDSGLILRCNVEGKLLGLPANIGIAARAERLARRDLVDWTALDDIVCGDCYFLRDDGEGDDASVTDSDIRAFGIPP